MNRRDSQEVVWEYPVVGQPTPQQLKAIVDSWEESREDAPDHIRIGLVRCYFENKPSAKDPLAQNGKYVVKFKIEGILDE